MSNSAINVWWHSHHIEDVLRSIQLLVGVLASGHESGDPRWLPSCQVASSGSQQSRMTGVSANDSTCKGVAHKDAAIPLTDAEATTSPDASTVMRPNMQHDESVSQTF